MSELETEYSALLASTWSTDSLVGMALAWWVYDDNSRTPVWQRIASTEDDARAFYRSLPSDELRELAVDALVSSGWTLHRINRKKS